MQSKLWMAGVLATALSLSASAADDPPKPPKGWSEYIPGTKAFGVWLPDGGKRSERTREVTYNGARLKISLVQVEKDKAIYRAEQFSLPVKPGEKVDAVSALEVFRDAFVKDVNGLVTADNDIKLGKMDGKEYVMEAGKSSMAKLHIYATGPRVYMVSMIGSKAQVEGEGAKVFFDSFKHQGMVKDELAAKEPNPGGTTTPGGTTAPKTPGGTVGTQPFTRGPRLVGGGFDKEFTDRAAEGNLLVGLEVGLGKFGPNDVVKAVRAVYRAGDKEALGEQHGTDTSRVVKAIAKPGYAVGAITVKAGLGVDGLSVTFMKLTDGKLDPKDAYESDWIGGKGGGAPVRMGDGTPLVGLVGKKNDREVTGLGVAYFGDRGTPTQIAGGGFDPEFREAAPDKGTLVGLEVGLGKFGPNDVVKAVRPVFRSGDKETPGTQRGTDITRVVKAIAKPGYAVGAITAKAGLGLDGLSVTFMKVTATGALDPKDSYDSEWIGGMGGGGPVKFGGDGTPVVGVVGKANKKEVTGIGLLLDDAPKK